MWAPKIGATVWMNFPDAPGPLGDVVGFVPEGHPRAGQPVIEATEDGRAHKKGERFAVHPMFLLPFKYGGQEWKQAQADGLIGG
jgi:hypothetical protein